MTGASSGLWRIWCAPSRGSSDYGKDWSKLKTEWGSGSLLSVVLIRGLLWPDLLLSQTSVQPENTKPGWSSRQAASSDTMYASHTDYASFKAAHILDWPLGAIEPWITNLGSSCTAHIIHHSHRRFPSILALWIGSLFPSLRGSKRPFRTSNCNNCGYIPPHRLLVIVGVEPGGLVLSLKRLDRKYNSRRYDGLDIFRQQTAYETSKLVDRKVKQSSIDVGRQAATRLMRWLRNGLFVMVRTQIHRRMCKDQKTSKMGQEVVRRDWFSAESLVNDGKNASMPLLELRDWHSLFVAG